MVEEYSDLKLTFEGDRLPALSGAAKHIMCFSPGRYLAGIWENDLIPSLLWDAHGHGIHADLRSYTPYQNRRPTSWRAPSWSWASTEGPVSFRCSANEEQHVKVIDIVCKAATSDITGAVAAGAYIELEGLVAPMKLRQNRTDELPVSGVHSYYYTLTADDQKEDNLASVVPDF